MPLLPLLNPSTMILPSTLALLFTLKLSAGAVCHFDASCTCTSAPPHLGQVECINTRVSLSRINASRLFSFALVNNQIDYLPPSLFYGTGLYRFQLSHNSVYQLDEDVFVGVETSLWELHLTYARLSAIPYKSIRHLQKLKTLNLTGNAILSISSEQLRGVASSLQVLILAENRLSFLPDGVFSVLQSLEILNLRGNALSTLEPAAFTPPPPKLSSLDLSDNNFKNMSYRQLAKIRALTFLDMSSNCLTAVADKDDASKLMLDSLYLDYNNITELESLSFVNYAAINKTSLKGNPLSVLQVRTALTVKITLLPNPNAFQPCKIRELYLTDCELTSIEPEAFDGLDDTLEVLDLSGNNIEMFKFPIIEKFDSLTSFRVDHNKLKNYDWMSAAAAKKPHVYNQLLELSILGDKNAPVVLQSFPRLSHLHTLAISQTNPSNLDPEQFKNFTVELETLKIEDGSVESLTGGIFKYIRGVKTLDLTDNNINSVDAQAFVEVSHSLERLILTHSFSSKVGAFPSGLLRPLSSLTVLKMNHNSFRKLPTDIRWTANLVTLHAHDNEIDSLPNSLFESNAHKKLKEVILSFNKIRKVQRGTFSELNCLATIDLSDNEINIVELGAFKNLPAIRRISFRGNKLSSLADEAFQNLPYLEKLDVSYNNLHFLSMASFDQVGTLTTLVVNASNNMISKLASPGPGGSYSVYGTIKVLDFSHNNISYMEKDYFSPIRDSLTQLILSHNSIRNVSRDVLPEMTQLQYLDISHNNNSDIEFDALRNLPLLQTFLIKGNKIKDLPTGLFSSSTRLECLDFSYNSLNSLTDSLIITTSPVLVDISYNSLIKVPLSSFSPSTAGNVRELILRSNRISRLPSLEAFSRFSGLRHLDLSDNKLTELGNSLGSLPCLTKLSLSYNRIRFDPNDWRGQERSLKHLDLSNASLSYIPALPLPTLLTLKLSNNGIAYIPPDLQTNLTDLKMLDVSYNIIPELTSFPQLVCLNVASNPISAITNSTFSYFTNLAELDIRKLPLTSFDEDALGQLPLLTLAISNYRQVGKFNIPLWIKDSEALRHLIYEAHGSSSIGMEMTGSLPRKINHITLEGIELKSIPGTLLEGSKRPAMRLTVRNTSVDTIDKNVFRTPYLRNISLELASSSLKTVSNPSDVGRPNVPHSVFLVDLKMLNSELTCDCNIGWIETWGRKKRQEDAMYYHGEQLRKAVCKNKKGKPLMDVLKTDLECGWSGAPKCSTTIAMISTLIVMVSYLL